MKARAIGAMILALVSIATPALAGPDGTIELYNVTINSNGSAGAVDFDACEAPVTVLFNGMLGRVSIAVYARLSGGTLPGIAGAEYYISGLEVGSQVPTGWTVTPVNAQGILAVGNAVAPHLSGGNMLRRVTATWDVDSGGCQTDALVLLARIDLTSPIGNPAFPNDVVATLVAGDPPSNQNFQCPFTFLCNSPVFTTFCATGTRFVINPVDESCTDAVEAKSWGAVKALFR